MIAQVCVGYEQNRSIVAIGQHIKELLQNISEKFDNLPSEYQLLYKNIRGHPQQISCTPTFNQFLSNYWLSLANGNQIPTLYIVRHHGRQYYNDEQDSLNLNFTCRQCFLRVGQYFRCFQCIDYLLCDICVQNKIHHHKGHQFIFIQRPENWNNLKMMAEVKSRNLQQDKQQNQFSCSSCIEMQIKHYLQQNTLKCDQVRYACLECNYDQCQDCYLEGMHKFHHQLRIDYSR